MRQRLGLANVQAFFDDALRCRERIGNADQRARVAGGQFARAIKACTSSGSFVSRIMLATWLRLLPTIFRDIVLAAFEFVGQRVIAARLFHRVEIFALHVLDDHDLQRVVVADIDRHDRHVMQAGALRGAPAPLAGDDLEAIRRALHRPHDDRLDHAMLPDRMPRAHRVRHRKIPARIARIGLQEFDRHLALRARRARHARLRRRHRRSDLQDPGPVANALRRPSPAPSDSRTHSGTRICIARRVGKAPRCPPISSRMTVGIG